MASSNNALQDSQWEALYQAIKKELAQWGVENAFGDGDYLVVDDNYGHRRQIVEVHKVKMLRPDIVTALRKLLDGYNGWEIVMAVNVPGPPPERKRLWPPMGVTIRKHEIIDGLLRQYLPPEFSNVHYAGSRPGTGYD